MKRSFFLLALVLPSLAIAQATYKCTVNGKSSYSDRPCGQNATTLAIGDSAEERERLRQAARDRQRASEAIAEVMRQNPPAPVRPVTRAPAPRADSGASSQQAYCDGLLRTAKAAKDEAAMYRYHQGLIDDAKRRQKEAEDEHFSKCYGTVR